MEETSIVCPFVLAIFDHTIMFGQTHGENFYEYWGFLMWMGKKIFLKFETIIIGKQLHELGE